MVLITARFPAVGVLQLIRVIKITGIVQRAKVPNFLFNNSTEGITQVSWMYNRIKKIGELFLASLRS